METRVQTTQICWAIWLPEAFPTSTIGVGPGRVPDIERGLTVTAEGAVGGVFEEFWADIARKGSEETR